jgi:hypothetical protein
MEQWRATVDSSFVPSLKDGDEETGEFEIAKDLRLGRHLAFHVYARGRVNEWTAFVEKLLLEFQRPTNAACDMREQRIRHLHQRRKYELLSDCDTPRRLLFI